jgi:glycosyltransferase involved in cell wall biosynthesis
VKVLSINYSFEVGGASIAARRINQSMLSHGLNIDEYSIFDSSVSKKMKSVLVRKVISSLKITNTSFNDQTFSLGITKNVETTDAFFEADICHLHWSGGEMFNITAPSFLAKPKIITLHDDWVNNGLSHYPIDDTKENLVTKLLTKWNKPRVERFLGSCSFIVAPSKWLQQRTQEHYPKYAAKILYIPNPIPHIQTQTICNDDRRGILFLSGDRSHNRKGSDTLLELLTLMEPAQRNQVALTIVGDLPSELKRRLSFLKLNTLVFMQKQDSDGLAALYSSHRILLHLSKIDNFPNTILEAGMNGLMTVGIDAGGSAEATEGFGQYFFPHSNLAELNNCIIQELNRPSPTSLQHFLQQRYSYKHIGKRYYELMEKIDKCRSQ